MKNKLSKMDNWFIDKVKTQYKDDVALLIGHNAYRLEEDKDKASVSFFFPATEKAYQLAANPIIAGVSYDIFPMSWERFERMAALDEDNASCVGDAEILYYRKEADKQRFLEIQDRLKKHLENPGFMLIKAQEKLDIAMGLYQGMLFEDALFKLRKAATYVVLYLSHAVAYSNRTYFSTSHQSHVADLQAMPGIPKDFIRLYGTAAQSRSAEELKKLCYEMIANTRQFLNAKKGTNRKVSAKPDFNVLAGWYQEISYAWREIYHWCDVNEPEKAFIRSGFLQSELDIIAEECGLKEMDLLGAFNANDLKAYRRRAETLEKQVVAAIGENGAVVEAYNTIEEFIRKNA
jgi:hypothetical protein